MSTSERVLEAERFLLKDAKGNVRAELSLCSGSPGLIFYDKNLKRRAELSLDEDSVGLQFFDETGLCRLQIALERDRPNVATPTISIGGIRGEGGIVLYVGPDAVTGIVFLDKDHKPTLDIPSQLPSDTQFGGPPTST
jgi:hypothetical protein